jgi:hypothetical protein
MEQNDLNQWLIDKATRLNCNLIGFAELDSPAQKEILYADYFIDESPASYAIILGIVLEDPIQDCWTQSPLWLNGKNFIDEVIARVATNLAFNLSKQGYPSRTLAYDSAYLKNLAVYAGLGIIGRNNLLITPQYGPHVRLRGLLTQAPLTASESLVDRFNPCAECPEPPPCIKACSAGAFQTTFQSNEMQEASEPLPFPLRSPRSGYNKSLCRNYSMGHLKEIGPFTYLWCRACEEACHIGKSNIRSKP